MKAAENLKNYNFSIYIHGLPTRTFQVESDQTDWKDSDPVWMFIYIHTLRNGPYHSPLQVLSSSYLCLDQVITVDGGGNGHLRQTAADKLKHRHLGGGVLHSHSIWSQAEIGAASVNVLTCRIIQVTVHYLLWQSKRPVESVRGMWWFNQYQFGFNRVNVSFLLEIDSKATDWKNAQIKIE